MKLGFVSDGLGGMPFETMLDHAARIGVSGVEVNPCGWSTAPHVGLAAMTADAGARRAFRKAFADRRLEIIALIANGDCTRPSRRRARG